MKKRLTRVLSFVLALVTVLSLLGPMGAEAAAMKQGSSGTEVKYLQQNLVGLGFLDGAADGKFGSKTKEAVKEFQTEFGLAPDGAAGNATQTAVYNAIVRLQVELKNAGYAPGSADGHFGSKTKKALEKYQKDRGLKVTGAMNTATWSSMNGESAGIRGGSSARSENQVRQMQLALIGLGFLDGNADGAYGTMTREAVRQFQKAYGLSADGSAGPDTMTALKNAVTALQSDLSRRGFYSGTVDSSFGNGTKSAVKAYQRYVGLEQTGIAGPKTMQKLYGYSLGGSDSGVTKTYKIWIDSIYQDGDLSRIWYDRTDRVYRTVESSGCAGVALAMALNALKETSRYTGKSVMLWFVDHGYYYGRGTEHEGILAYPRVLGLNSTYCSRTDTLIQHLKKGRLAVVLIRDVTGNATFTYSGGGGHYVLVSGYREKDGVDQVFVNNPLSYKSSGWFDVKVLKRNWIHRSDLDPCVIIYK